MDQGRPPSFLSRLRRVLIGRPIASKHAHKESLNVPVGLTVFASDALSSIAYATEAILGVLVLGALSATLAWPLSIAITVLILLVAMSYRQIIFAYDQGGGSYIVAKENLGKVSGFIAGSALLIDYILTVSVSVAAGVAAIVSAFPQLHSLLTPISLVAVAIIAWANLRGVRESGLVVAIPAYGFILSVIIMLIKGFIATAHNQPNVHLMAEPHIMGKEADYAYLYLLLRAFAAGCTALTGIEAVSNGVTAFSVPRSRNAALTLTIMAGILGTLFLSIGWVALRLPELTLFQTKNPQYTTLVSQIAAYGFGKGSAMFYIIQFATAAILIMAANTSFAGFPRLAGMLSADGYLPRSFMRQGDRLVFQNGVVALAALAGGLIVYFHGELDLLLPLYAIGVFTAFTFSQVGMVKHWLAVKGAGWTLKMALNGLGGIVTGVVAIIILATKFSEGAWIVVVLIFLFCLMFWAIERRYQSMARQLALAPTDTDRPPRDHTVLVLVPRLHKGTLLALEYGDKLSGDRRAVHVAINDHSVKALGENWEQHNISMPLVVLKSPYRSLTEPLLEYVDEMLEENPARLITVVVAEAFSRKPWHRLLHESIALQMKVALGARRNVVVSSVRYFLE